jgi:hypothetical protein
MLTLSSCAIDSDCEETYSDAYDFKSKGSTPTTPTPPSSLLTQMINDFRSKGLDPGSGAILSANEQIAAAVLEKTEATDEEIEELEKVQLGEKLSWKQWGIVISVGLRRDKEAAS